MTPSEQSRIPFAEAREKALGLLRKLREIASAPVGIDVSAIDALFEAIRAPLFTVAVTGPSRAGKSTLINALLHSEVSPIGELPTTGLPCVFQPGVKDRIRIVLKDGKEREEPRTIAIMKAWATQDLNLDNEKGASRIEVDLESPALDLGYALVDLPGLDDAGADAHSMTEIALEGANCVLYVMNGRDFANSRFIITRDERLALERVARRIEKTLFLVNVADPLSKEQEEKLLSFVEREFKRFNLPLFKRESFFFVNARSAFEYRAGTTEGRSDQDLGKFEHALWEYLIGKSEVGRARLRSTLGEANELVADQIGIAALALERTEKVLHLKSDLVKFDEIEPRIQFLCSQGYSESLTKVNRRLSELQPKASGKFRQYITSIPFHQPLPTRQEVKAMLDSEMATMAADIQRLAQESFENTASRASEEVRALIQAFREDMRTLSPGMGAVWQSMNLGAPIQGNMFPGLGGAISLGLLGLAFGPIGGLVGAVIGFFGGLLFGESNRRQKEIADLLPKYDQAVNQVCDQIATQIDRWLSASYGGLQQSVLARLRAAKIALRNQLEHLGEPLSEEQATLVRGTVASLTTLQPEIRTVLSALAAN